jgi:hypothetical protein
MFREQLERNQQFWQNPSRWAYLILAPWVIGAVFMTYQSRHLITSPAGSARSRVQSSPIEPQNHDRYIYEFNVGGRVYKVGLPPESPLTLGEKVQVYYDPTDPRQMRWKTSRAQS